VRILIIVTLTHIRSIIDSLYTHYTLESRKRRKREKRREKRRKEREKRRKREKEIEKVIEIVRKRGNVTHTRNINSYSHSPVLLLIRVRIIHIREPEKTEKKGRYGEKESR